MIGSGRGRTGGWRPALQVMGQGGCIQIDVGQVEAPGLARARKKRRERPPPGLRAGGAARAATPGEYGPARNCSRHRLDVSDGKERAQGRTGRRGGRRRSARPDAACSDCRRSSLIAKDRVRWGAAELRAVAAAMTVVAAASRACRCQDITRRGRVTIPQFKADSALTPSTGQCTFLAARGGGGVLALRSCRRSGTMLLLEPSARLCYACLRTSRVTSNRADPSWGRCCLRRAFAPPWRSDHRRVDAGRRGAEPLYRGTSLCDDATTASLRDSAHKREDEDGDGVSRM